MSTRIFIPKKKGTQQLDALGWGWKKRRSLVPAVLPLVLGVAIQGTRASTGCTADQRACARVARLMADDRTGTSA